jgi:anti-sigma B factor antagonist
VPARTSSAREGELNYGSRGEGPLSPTFDIDIVRRGDTAFVLVSGEIDLATGPELDATLTEAEASTAKTIVVDRERVTFMDARGVDVLIRHATDEERGHRLRFAPGSIQVQRLFDLSGLRAQLPLYSLS